LKKSGERDPLFRTRWVHVFEEDTAEGEVYRPETEDVPLSRRPRRRLSLSPDGTARVLVPGPDDRLVEVPARWEAEGERAAVSASRGAGKSATVIRIRDRSATRLVISRSK
jgi:hypothetical protein